LKGGIRTEVGGRRSEEVSGFRVQCSGKKKPEDRGRRSEVGDQQGQETRLGFSVQVSGKKRGGRADT